METKVDKCRREMAERVAKEPWPFPILTEEQWIQLRLWLQVHAPSESLGTMYEDRDRLIHDAKGELARLVLQQEQKQQAKLPSPAKTPQATSTVKLP